MTKWKTSETFQWKLFSKTAQARLQKFGGVLSGMIIPIIGIIIAWGLLTMFFIPTGFTPVKAISDIIVGPTINYVVPILVGFMGGRIFYETRGGVLGAFAAAGAVFAAKWWITSNSTGLDFGKQDDQNMLMAAMIVGPLSALALKHLEKLWTHKIPAGYEMLINNFSLAIFAFAVVLISMFGVTPIVLYFVYGIGKAAGSIESVNALPILSILIEPAKPLFLNNAIGNGTLVPIGLQQVAENGKSILFFAEANPGPGMGMLLGFVLFGIKREKAQALGALPVHFIGGIHEVYFPFVLSNFKLVFPLIISGAFGLGMMQLFGSGLIAPMSPGSVIAAYTSSAHGGYDYAGMSLAIFGSAGVSLLGTWIYIKFRKPANELSLDQAAVKLAELKGKESKYVKINPSNVLSKIKLINVACDQGEGSSAIGATTLRKILKANGFNDVAVVNTAIKELRNDADLVVTSYAFKDHATKMLPKNAQLLTINNFIGDQNYDEVLQSVKGVNTNVEILKLQEIHTNETKKAFFKFDKLNSITSYKAKSITDLITKSGELLVESKLVKKDYIKSMIARNKDVSVAIGGGLAIPHGKFEDKKLVLKSGLSIILVPEGIEWTGQKVFVVIGIAAKNDDHMTYIEQISTLFSDENFAKKLSKCNSVEEINKVMN